MTVFPCTSFRLPFLGLLFCAALALFALDLPSAAQDKQDTKKDTKDTKDTKKDTKDTKDTKKDAKDTKDTKKDAKDTKDTKKDAKDTKKDDKKKEEPKDERIYPKVDPVLEFKGHTDWINSVLWLGSDKFLVTGSRDKTLRVWEVASGKEALKIKDLPANAVALAASADGTKLITTAGKWNKEKMQWIGEINLYDAKIGKLLATIKGHSEAIKAVALSPDGTRLVTASDDGTAKLWDLTGKELFTLNGHTAAVIAVACDPSGKLIATGSEDKTVKVWNAETGKEERTLKGPSRFVSCVAFSPDAKYLAAGSWDGTVTLWDADTGKEVSVLKADEGVLTVAFSPDSTKLATGGWEKVVKIWDVKTGKELGGLAGHQHNISSVIFNKTGDQVVSASLDGTVRVWNVSAARQKVDPPKKEEKK
jgi:WD40 repeat protein